MYSSILSIFNLFKAFVLTLFDVSMLDRENREAIINWFSDRQALLAFL